MENFTSDQAFKQDEDNIYSIHRNLWDQNRFETANFTFYQMNVFFRILIEFSCSYLLLIWLMYLFELNNEVIKFQMHFFLKYLENMKHIAAAWAQFDRFMYENTFEIGLNINRRLIMPCRVPLNLSIEQLDGLHILLTLWAVIRFFDIRQSNTMLLRNMREFFSQNKI